MRDTLVHVQVPRDWSSNFREKVAHRQSTSRMVLLKAEPVGWSQFFIVNTNFEVRTSETVNRIFHPQGAYKNLTRNPTGNHYPIFSSLSILFEFKRDY